MRRATIVWPCLIALWLAPLWAGAPAAAEKRLALLIGNNEYTELGRLLNPVNDMKLMAETLRRLGFEVTDLADADQAAMKRAIQDFGRRLDQAGADAIGLFYYAGHGVQVGGTNFLIPLNAQIQREPDVEIEAVKLDWVLAQMEYARNRMNILILDACRNNPLSRSFRSSEQGLSRIDAPHGTLIAYATAPGSVSFDGDGANSPYTEALAETILEPGVVVESAFRTVRVKVMEATGNRQVPWESSSLTGPFYFNPAPEPDGDTEVAELSNSPQPADDEAPKASGRTTEPSSADTAQADLLFWESIEDTDSAPLLEEYLRRFPDGLFAAIARQRLESDAEATVTQDDSTAPSNAAAPEDDKKRKETPAPASEQVALAPAIGQPLDPSALAGRWEGRYHCQQDEVGMALQLEPLGGERVAARFEFFPAPGAQSFPSGSFEASGVLERDSRRLRLEAGEWIERPWGFQRHDLDGVVQADGRTIEGRILTTGCSEFTVRHRADRS